MTTVAREQLVENAIDGSLRQRDERGVGGLKIDMTAVHRLGEAPVVFL